jgi:hypothetical protein
VAEEEPVAITTDAGTVASTVLDDRVMVKPPPGAAPFKVTVPTAVDPPGIGLGLTDTPVRVAGVIARVAVAVTPPREAEIVEFVDADTPVVATVKLAVVAPAGRATDAGVEAAFPLADRLTAIPPAGAGRLRVTVPVEGLPPTTVVGKTDTD